MASHGKKRHLKRLAAPKALAINRKEHLWLKAAVPGSHAKEHSIQLLVLLRDLLKVCRTTAEAKKLIHSGQVKIDGKPVKDINCQVGLMDVLTLQGHGSFLILNKRGKLLPVKTDLPGYKLCKVTGKQVIAGGKTQLSLHDGRTLLVPDGKIYCTGDTLKLAIPKTSIMEHFKLEKGSTCYVYSGRHAGAIGSLVEVKVFPGITPSNAKIVDEKGSEVVTLKGYVFVVDKQFKA